MTCETRYEVPLWTVSVDQIFVMCLLSTFRLSILSTQAFKILLSCFASSQNAVQPYGTQKKLP